MAKSRLLKTLEKISLDAQGYYTTVFYAPANI